MKYTVKQMEALGITMMAWGLFREGNEEAVMVNRDKEFIEDQARVLNEKEKK